MKARKAGSAICAGVMFLSAMSLSSCGRKTVNLNDYLEINISGYDGYAKASYFFDIERMISENPEAFDLNSATNEMGIAAVELQLSDIASSSGEIGGKLDKNKKLKNGDKVTFTWDELDTDAISDAYPVKFKFEEMSKDVSGLPAAKDYDPFSEVTLEFSGFDGKGTVSFDEVVQHDDVGLVLSADKTSELSNGDKLTVSVVDAEEIEDICLENGIKLTATSKEYTVSGLDEIQDVDLFEHLTIGYEGIAPNGKVILDTDGYDIGGYDLGFSADKPDGLSNGDTIKVTISDYTIEACGENGINPTPTEKEYTVEGLSSYVTDFSQIPEADIENMKNNNKDIMDAHVASNWSDPEAYKKLTFKGCYMLVPKNEVGYGGKYNELYFVYKVNYEKDKDKGSYYWVTGYTNIMQLENGECSYDLSEAGVRSVSSNSLDIGDFATSWFSSNAYGFKDIKTLYNKVITSQIDSYNEVYNSVEE